MGLFWSLEGYFYGTNGPSKKGATNATGEPTLHTGLCMAYYPSVSQEGVSFEIRQGPEPISALAFRGQEAFWSEHFELHGDL